MAIVEMRKVTLIGLDEEKSIVTDILHKAGCLQITESSHDSDDYYKSSIPDVRKPEQLDAFLGDISRAREALLPYDKRKKNVFEPKKSLSADQFEDRINRETEIFGRVKKINELMAAKTALSAEENKADARITMLRPWETLDLDLSTEKTSYSSVVFGIIPSAFSIENVVKALNEDVRESSFHHISSDNQQHYVCVIMHGSVLEEGMKTLRRFSFSQMHFKGMHGTAADNIKTAEKSKETIQLQKKDTDRLISAETEHMADFEILSDHLMLEKQKYEHMQNIAAAGRTFLMEGWMPAKKTEALMKLLGEQTHVYFHTRRPEKDEAFPILLRNSPLVRPFELITELFSLPNHHEFDVNPFMAPFYFVFFGLMLGDAGYGLILFVLSGIVLLKFKLKGTVKKLMSMVFLGGISTFIWGVLFGSWFGDIFTQVSDGRFTIKPLWFNPLEDPMKLLLWACVFGVIQLYTGMALKGYRMWRDGRRIDAVIDIGLRYLYYTGLILMLASVPYAGYAAGAGAAGLVLTQGRAKKGIGKISGGLLALYDVVGFMSDVLSYSRLLALGLATGVVASVINTMGTLFGMNFLGIIVLVIVFAGGHVFNIAINTLGAYVHSSRLQYVEFFSKFYEGGGKPYKPFRYDTKFTNINNGGIYDGISDER